MRVLLDTNTYSELKRGHPWVANRVRNSRLVLFSVVVAGELIHGFRAGVRYDQNWTELQAFLSRPRVKLLDVDLETADRFGRIASLLRSKGTPIPTNDIWIAAHAMQHGAELLSFDVHFARVDGLVWERRER
jgi:tRNA(fMet)-specific endonuclease VapC